MKLSVENVGTGFLKETLAYDSKTDQRICFYYDFESNTSEFVYSVRKLNKEIKCASIQQAINLWNNEETKHE